MSKLIERIAIRHANKLFRQAAKVWERGNNSGDPVTLAKCDTRCDTLREQAEAVLREIGVTVSYPGLFPTWRFEGKEYPTAESLITWHFAD